VNVSAIIVTRGDVELQPILTSLPEEWEKVVWDNSMEAHDLGPYGKYAAIERANHALIYVQDDDVVVSDPEAIVWESDSGGSEYGRLVCNMPPEFRPHYPDSAMVGFGAAFHRDLPERAFQRFFSYHATMTRDDPLFLRESCRAFTTLTPYVLVDVPKTDLPYVNDPNRLWKQPGHISCRDRMLALAREVRDDH
jgi:hypothetical protein